MIILRLLLLLTNLHLKLLSTQGTGADKLLSTQRVNVGSFVTTINMTHSLIMAPTLNVAIFWYNNRRASMSQYFDNLIWDTFL